MTALVGTSGARSEINVTPLIDVLLVLLIIFLVITPLTPKGLPAAVPQEARVNAENSESAIVLELMRDGALRLNTGSLRPVDLTARIEQIFRLRAEKVLFIRADRGLEFREVAKVIDVVRGVDPSIQIGLWRRIAARARRMSR